MTRWMKIIGGFSLVLLGVIGLALPLVPGLVFLTAGAILLAPSYPVVQRVLNWLRLGQSSKTSGFKRKD